LNDQSSSSICRDLSVIILAAGKGKRMKSDVPKVLHQICFKPVLYYILKSAFDLNPDNVFVVVGFGKEEVENYLKENFPSCISVFQEQQLGSAHAVLSVREHKEKIAKNTLIIAGDMPLLSFETLNDLLNFKLRQNLNAALITALLDEPTGYGRIIKDKNGKVIRIVEEADATPEQKEIKEVNASIYCFDSNLLFDFLERINSHNAQGEFYLTDIIEALSGEKSYSVGNYIVRDSSEAEGINDRMQLSNLEKVMQEKINKKYMLSGVTIKNPGSVFIEPGVEIGKDTIIEPFTLISGKTKIGEKCLIGPFTQIDSSLIGRETIVNESVIYNSKIGDFNSIGPMSYVGENSKTDSNTVIGPYCKFGNNGNYINPDAETGR